MTGSFKLAQLTYLKLDDLKKNANGSPPYATVATLGHYQEKAMAEIAFDEFSRRYRLYVRWLVRRICASILGKEKLERLTEDVLIRLAQKARHFSASDLDRKKLSPRVCEWLNNILCALLEDELSDVQLLGLMARQQIIPTSALKAFDEFCRRFTRDLTMACKRHLPRNGDAQDLAQEVLCRAYKKAHKFDADKGKHKDKFGNRDPHSDVLAWLSTMAHNMVKDQRRKDDRKDLTIVNATDVGTKTSDESNSEANLEDARWQHEGTTALLQEAEEQHYPSLKSPADEMDVSELIEMVAAMLLLPRELKVFLTETAHYASEEELAEARRELEACVNISTNNRSKIFSRCKEKPRKYLCAIAQKLLSTRDLKIFMAIAELYSQKGSKENAWREMESTYHLTRAELREIWKHGSKKIKSYLKDHAHEYGQLVPTGRFPKQQARTDR